MAIVYDFQKARDQKFSPEPYVAPPLMERVPEDIQEALQIDAAERQRRTLKVVNAVIKSVDIPPKRELSEDEQSPTFEYPPIEEK
jgi:hypothetical protein